MSDEPRDEEEIDVCPPHQRREGETACANCGAELRIEVPAQAKCPPHYFILPPPPAKGTKMVATCKRCGATKNHKVGLAKPRKAGGHGRPGYFPVPHE